MGWATAAPSTSNNILYNTIYELTEGLVIGQIVYFVVGTSWKRVNGDGVAGD